MAGANGEWDQIFIDKRLCSVEFSTDSASTAKSSPSSAPATRLRTDSTSLTAGTGAA
ncbi:hypothetical protein [Kibdelosporangium philippinense]|uniref:hypothetical protein n=1 Tax=Kibdelosporangium philippinense TaxID=211113 RepID=UPI0036104FE6